MPTFSLRPLRPCWSTLALALGALATLAAPPKVVVVVPDNGAKAVDPNLKELRISFDQAMSTGGMSIVGGGPTFPKLIGKPRWTDDRTLVATWQLEPEKDYWLSINSDRFTNFRNRQGEAAIPYPISFRTGPRTAPVDHAQRNREAYEILKRTINEDYSYRDRRGVNWEERFAAFAPRLRILTTPRKVAESWADLLSPAQDLHLWFECEGQVVPTYIRQAEWNVAFNTLPKQVPGWQQRSPVVFTGKYEDGIRYVCLRSWPGGQAAQLEPAFQVLGEAAQEKQPLIIDVRANGGGAEPLAAQFAGCFIAKPAVYARHVVRSGGKFSDPMDRVLEPNAGRPRFQGRVAVLMGAGTVSSSESFAMMMKQVPGCTLIGGATAGASGNPRPIELGNGLVLYTPSWRDLRLDGTCLEGEGFAPDLAVKATPEELEKDDPVLRAALALLRKSQ